MAKSVSYVINCVCLQLKAQFQVQGEKGKWWGQGKIFLPVILKEGGGGTYLNHLVGFSNWPAQLCTSPLKPVCPTQTASQSRGCPLPTHDTMQGEIHWKGEKEESKHKTEKSHKGKKSRG